MGKTNLYIVITDNFDLVYPSFLAVEMNFPSLGVRDDWLTITWSSPQANNATFENVCPMTLKGFRCLVPVAYDFIEDDDLVDVKWEALVAATVGFFNEDRIRYFCNYLAVCELVTLAQILSAFEAMDQKHIEIAAETLQEMMAADALVAMSGQKPW